jgi:outer membrane protein insertion porin family
VNATALALVIAVALAAAPQAARAEGSDPGVVLRVAVSGNVHIGAESILAVVKTKPGSAFDDAVVREDVQAILELGYFADQKPPLIERTPNGVAVTFQVIENPIIRRIVFSGNETVPAKTLIALMDTAVGAILNTNAFHRDILRINSYYDHIGFGGQLPSHVIALSIAKDGELSLTIRESLTIRRIKIFGIIPFGADEIYSVLALRAGGPYSEDIRNRDFANIRHLVEQRGYFLAGSEAGIDPPSVDVQNGTADVSYYFNVAAVGAILITGNKTIPTEEYLDRACLRPGQFITQSKIDAAIDRFAQIAPFSKVTLSLKPGPDPRRPDQWTLHWDINESATTWSRSAVGAPCPTPDPVATS